MRYDNVISLCATIGSEQKDLSDLTREQVIAVFTSRINDLFDHDEFHEVYDLADQVETEGGAVMSDLREKVWRRMAGHYLCDTIPENWCSLSEEEQDEWMLDNAWEPFEWWSASRVLEQIDAATDTVMDLIKEVQS